MLLRLLESCIRSRSLIQGKIIHQQLLKHSVSLLNPVALRKLIHLYTSCNELEQARRVFDGIPQPTNPISWDLLIRAYASNGNSEKALDLFFKMIDSGVKPTRFTYPFVLKACSGLRAIKDGKLVHDYVRNSNLSSNVYVSTALIDFYSKCGDLRMAEKVFYEMPMRDTVAWNAMISGLSLHGDYESSIRFLIDMQRRYGLKPNSSTIVGLLPGIGSAGALREAKAVHGYCARMGLDGDFVAQTGILDMYCKCKCIVYGSRVFDLMCIKNYVTWAAMLGGYVECDMIKEAKELFHQMLVNQDIMILTSVALGLILRGFARTSDIDSGRCLHCFAIKTSFVLDLTVSNTLISLYAKCRIYDDAVKFFVEMDLKDVVSCNAIISGCVENDKTEEAIRFFLKMRSYCFQPDSATILGILPAISHLAALQTGICCHGFVIVNGFTVDTSICNALIDMYSKCGKVHVARQVFDSMHKRDTVSWNTMIYGYGIHGLGNESVFLFYEMLATGLNPDDITFLCVLSACSHSGLVDEGKVLFSSMTRDFNISPRIDHFICTADLLARAGHLNEAYNLIKTMPFEPDFRIWCVLLAGCRKHKNVNLAGEISKKERLEHSGNFVLLSNVYCDAGRWDDAANSRRMQRNLGFDKIPGYSWNCGVQSH